MATLEALTAMGTKLNGWVKVAVVLAGIVAGYATLRSDVGHLTREISRVEATQTVARQEIKDQQREDLREIKERLARIEQLLLEERR